MAKEKRFDTLYFQGPVFPEEYKPRGYKLAGEVLPSLAEEMLWACASYYLHETYWKRLVELNNFWQCLKPELTANQQKLSFPSDFETLLAEMKATKTAESEAKKQWKKDNKVDAAKEKEENDKFRDEHNFCLINGKKVKCPYQVEGPSLIMSHPGDPKFGAWKYRVDPKDVTLNIVKSKKPEGWKGKVVSSNTSQWIFKYKMDCGRKDMSCYVQLAKKANVDAKSDIAQGNTSKKFDKTMKAIKKYKKLEKHIEDGLKSSDLKTQQTALVTWLISQTGIRVGNEKNLNISADTVGATTLKVKDIILN